MWPAERGLPPSLLFNWRRRMLEGRLRAVEADEDVVGTRHVRELERQVRELERLLGRKTMKVENSQGSTRRRAGKKNRHFRCRHRTVARTVRNEGRG
jgi:transposase